MKRIVRFWYRNIYSNISQILSMTAIVFLGVSFLIGLLSSAPTIKKDVNSYINGKNLYDIKIQSKTKIDDEHIKAIENLSEISDVNISFEQDLWMALSDDKLHETRIFYRDSSLQNEKFQLIDGKMPENENEAVLISARQEKIGSIGEYIRIYDDKAKDEAIAKYKIVGIAKSPEFISVRGEVTSIGSGKMYNAIYVNDEKIKSGANVKNLRLTLDYENGIENRNIFSKAYDKKIKKVEKLLKSLDEGRRKNTSAEDAFKDPLLKYPWSITSMKNLNGISLFADDIEKVDAIAKIFPIFFFLVAFLVVVTTMSRIVDKNRGEIGTLSSLGYGKNCVFKIYISYGVLTALVGGLAAVPLGFSIFPKVIAKAYEIGYILPEIKTHFEENLAMAVVGAAVLLVAVAAAATLRKVLMEKPAELFLFKSATAGKKIFLEKLRHFWSSLSFKSKISLRNIFRYKKRLYMTTLGIAGCFALVLTSFGLKDSLSQIVSKQFDDIYTYRLSIGISNGDIRLSENHGFEKNKPFYMKQIDVDGREESEKASLLVGKADDIKEFITFRDENNDEKKVNFKGAVISYKLKELLNVEKGEKIVFSVDDKEISISISGFFKNYLGHQIIVEESIWENTIGKKVDYNTILANSKEEYVGKKLEDKIEALMSEKGVLYIVSIESVKEAFSQSVKNIDYIVAVLNICAGLLAFIILYSLININIMERIREIATIKVLGFYKKETYNYIFREINILAAMGSAIGVPMGILLHRFVIGKIEVGGMMLDKKIQLLSYIISFVMIFVFVFFTNLMMRRKIDKINMVEALKANE